MGAASADNQLPGNTYDGNGNPSVYGGKALSFDPQSRLTSYNNGSVTCGYREDGLRAWKQNSGGRTYFLYDKDDAVCELNTSGAVVATNSFGARGLASRHSSAGSTFYDFDLSGNVAQRLSSGAVASNDVDDASASAPPATPAAIRLRSPRNSAGIWTRTRALCVHRSTTQAQGGS